MIALKGAPKTQEGPASDKASPSKTASRSSIGFNAANSEFGPGAQRLLANFTPWELGNDAFLEAMRKTLGVETQGQALTEVGALRLKLFRMGGAGGRYVR